MLRLRHVVLLLVGLALVGSALPVVATEESLPGPSSSPAIAADDTPLLQGLATDSSDVPQFAGPATLMIDGGPGVYRWADVHFGAQEVVVRVALVPAPGADSCEASVRLGSSKPPLYRDVYRADSAEKATHRGVVDVDYETVPMLVTSDCGSWSLTLVPRDDPTMSVTISERNYTVEGKTIAEIERALEHIDGEWAAKAWSRAKWTYKWIDHGSHCEVVSGNVSVKASLRMPQWKPSPDVDARVVSEWERVRANLLIHELGHVTFALQGADAVDDRLDAGLKAKTCKKVDRSAGKKATAIWDRHQVRDDRYDRHTDHGRTQGAWFE